MGWVGDFKLKGGFTQSKNLSLFALGVYKDSAEDGFALLYAMALFAFIHLAWKKSVLQREQEVLVQRKSVTLPARAVWLWNNNGGLPANFLVKDVLSNPNPYFTWAKKHNVNQTWIDVYPVLNRSISASKLKDFCKLATQNSMIVNFLGLSSPLFALKPHHEEAQDQLKAMFVLIAQIDANDRPAGIQADIEPQTLNKVSQYNDDSVPNEAKLLWDSDKHEILTQYLAVVAALKATCDSEIQKLGQYINLCLAVPFWWLNNADEVYSASPGALSQFVGNLILAAGVDVAVMDYRSALGDAQLIADEWSVAAGNVGQMAWIGFETKPGDPNYSGKATELEPDIKSVAAKLQGEIGFATMAVDDANGYWNLAP